jgi:hypothetical protein
VSDWLGPIEGTLWQVSDEEYRFTSADGARHISIVNARGVNASPAPDGQAAMMAPETELLYLREQLRHRDRELEELRAVFEMRMRSLADSEAAIRVLVRMMADPAQRFHL